MVFFPETKYNLTIPSCILADLIILIHPISLVISQWVPQQASTSVSSILTILSEFPGTIPPWYKLNPYSFSAIALSSKYFLIGKLRRTKLLAAFSISNSYSLVNPAKWVISKWA